MSFAFFFPGQGSQSLGMMNGFAEQAIVKATFDEASAVLGQDLWAMINGEDAELIGQTVNTQPIMLAAGVATYRAYLEAGGKIPSVVAGHSLGEYTALVAAGALDFADAVKLVRLRAELMQSAVPQGVGAMAAILGLEDDQVKAICAEAAQGKVVEAELEGRRDGSVVYETKVIGSDGSRYDIDVSASDGKVLRSEARPGKHGKRPPAGAPAAQPADASAPAAQ